MSALGYEPTTSRMATPPKGFVERRQARFLAAYAEYGMISRAARVAKTTRWSHQEWMKDPVYAQRFKEAGDKFTQKVEDTLHLVGVHGVERPIVHKGKQVYIEGKPLFENKRSEMILMRIAEARMPEKYKPRVKNPNLMDIDPDKLTPEILDKLADHLIQKALKEKGLNNPAAVAEVTKRLEAGETVTVEELEREQTEEPGK